MLRQFERKFNEWVESFEVHNCCQGSSSRLLSFSFDLRFLMFFLCLFSILCIPCFCVVLCVVSPSVYSCLFSIFVQFYLPLPSGGNRIAVNKYIISYPIISCRIIYHIVSYCILSHRIVSYTTSYHISNHIVSLRKVSYRIVSYHYILS